MPAIGLGLGLQHDRGSRWTPARLPGLLAWRKWDSAWKDDEGTPAAHGDTVRWLPDLSGNGWYIEQEEANLMPTVGYFNGVDGSNGGCLEFEGPQVLNRENVMFGTGLSGITFAMVIRQGGGPLGQTLFSSNGGTEFQSGGGRNLFQLKSNSAETDYGYQNWVIRRAAGAATQRASGVSAFTPDPVIMIAVFDYAGGEMRYYRNGLLHQTIALNENNTGLIGNDPVRLFLGNQGGSVYIPFAFGEEVVYSRAISPAEVAPLNSYLKRRFRL